VRKAAAYAISLLFAGAVATALAQIPASDLAPGQPDPARPGSRGGARQPMPPGPNPDSQYRLGPDSLPQEGVPKGEIRVFLCDGRNDNRGIRNGVYDEKMDWFYQNVRLMKALTRKGYDVNYAWGINRHGQKFGGAIMPEVMRWLWRDGPVSTDPNDIVERTFRQPVTAREQ
jgi:hypothetical protein